MKFTARLSSLLFTALLFFFGFHSSLYAQTISTSRPLPQMNTEANVPQDLRTFLQVTVIEGLSSVSCIISGADVIQPGKQCLGFNPATQKIGALTPEAQDKGVIGMMGGMIGATYNLPVNTTSYTSYLADNFGIVKPAYAQGTGFTGFNQVLGLWTKFRDISYMGFVIIFVIIGMGTMLRIKIDPKTVMSIQNQIPKVIIAIMLITFSYAIAGLMVDLMWVGTYFGINVITTGETCTAETDARRNGETVDSVGSTATKYLYNNPIIYTHNILAETKCLGDSRGIIGLSKNVGETIGHIAANSVFEAFGMQGTDEFQCGLLNFDDCVKNALKIIIEGIGMLIIIAAIFIALLRVWFTLIKSYVMILIYVIGAPLFIIGGLLPNSSLGFGSWIRHLIARLSVFPVTVFMLVMARIFATADGALNVAQPTRFLPPLLSNPSTSANLGYMAALGLILLTPEAINIISSALKAPPSKLGASVASGINAGRSIAMNPISGAVGGLFAKDSSGNPKGVASFYLRDRVTAPLSRWAFGDKNKYANRMSNYGSPEIQTRVVKKTLDDGREVEVVRDSNGNERPVRGALGRTINPATTGNTQQPQPAPTAQSQQPRPASTSTSRNPGATAVQASRARRINTPGSGGTGTPPTTT